MLWDISYICSFDLLFENLYRVCEASGFLVVAFTPKARHSSNMTLPNHLVGVLEHQRRQMMKMLGLRIARTMNGLLRVA